MDSGWTPGQLLMSSRWTLLNCRRTLGEVQQYLWLNVKCSFLRSVSSFTDVQYRWNHHCSQFQQTELILNCCKDPDEERQSQMARHENQPCPVNNTVAKAMNKQVTGFIKPSSVYNILSKFPCQGVKYTHDSCNMTICCTHLNLVLSHPQVLCFLPATACTLS